MANIGVIGGFCPNYEAGIPPALEVAERQFPRPAAKVVGLIRKSNLPVHPGESLNK